MTRPREAQLPLLLAISEGLCRGTDEMLKVSPKGDAIHPPSCGLAIRDAVEEIRWLRAEVERLRAKNEKLRAVLEMVRDADDDCRMDGLSTIPAAARQSIDDALEAEP